jgi:hypothetical protein
MSEPSVPRQRPPQGNQPIAGDRPPSDPAWLRPTLMFLLGLLIGTLIIAASRPLPSTGSQPAKSGAATTDNPNCDLVIADAEHLAELAERTAKAAKRQDATSLSSLVRELNESQTTLDVDATGGNR